MQTDAEFRARAISDGLAEMLAEELTEREQLDTITALLPALQRRRLGLLARVTRGAVHDTIPCPPPDECTQVAL